MGGDAIRASGELREIPLDQILPNPEQPRMVFDEVKLSQLAHSIRESGVLQPIIVKEAPDNGHFILIAGERRLRASRLAGRSTIPATIHDTGDMIEIAIAENLQREDLHPIEEAEALLKLKTCKGYSDRELGQVLGIFRSNVSQRLALTRLPDKIKRECQHVNTASRALLHAIVTAETREEMLAMWERHKQGELSLVQARRERGKENKLLPKPVESGNLVYEGVRDCYCVRIYSNSYVPKEAVPDILQKELDEMLLG